MKDKLRDLLDNAMQSVFECGKGEQEKDKVINYITENYIPESKLLTVDEMEKIMFEVIENYNGKDVDILKAQAQAVIKAQKDKARE